MAFVAPFLMGALTERQRVIDESDKITGKVVDTVAPYILNKIFEEEKLNDKQMKLFNSYSNRYGNNFARVVSKAGLLDSGEDEKSNLLIKDYFKTDDLDSVKKLIDEKAKSSTDFQKQFEYNPITGRGTQLKDKKEFINNLFSDRANLMKLMIDPDKPKSGLSDFLFGPRLQTKDVPGAITRVAESARIPETPTTTPQDISGYLGITKPFSELSFLELRGRSDTRSLSEANRLYTEGRAEFRDKFLAKGVFTIPNKLDQAQFKKESEDFKKKTGQPFPSDEQDWYFYNKFFPMFLKQQGRNYAPTIPVPEGPTTKTISVKEEKPITTMDTTGPMKDVNLNINPRSREWGRQVNAFLEKSGDEYKKFTPNALVNDSNIAIDKLQKSNLPADIIEQRIEFIRSVTRLQLTRLGVEPKDYGY